MNGFWDRMEKKTTAARPLRPGQGTPSFQLHEPATTGEQASCHVHSWDKTGGVTVPILRATS